jgi:hypothetical protein
MDGGKSGTLELIALAEGAGYAKLMTRLLEQAVATVSALPDDVQDELAHMLLQCVGVEPLPYELTPDEEADIAASMAEAARGEFSTDEEVRAMWAKHGR